MQFDFDHAVDLLYNSDHITVFTGAGISVESGIPPFRGKDGIWNKYNPSLFTIEYFQNNPEKSWQLIKDVFYEQYGEAKPNKAHKVIAKWEKKGIVDAVITQNIDGLHQKAGSETVYEFHGSMQKLICTSCNNSYDFNKNYLKNLPPECETCNSILKPDFVFFGEGIPEKAYRMSFVESEKADLFIVIGTTGEVVPASLIPQRAKRQGASIIEINTKKSTYTDSITDVFLKAKATKMMGKLDSLLRGDNYE